MSAKINNKIDLMIEELESALKFENDEDRIDLKSSFIQLDILKEVKILMEEKKLSRTELAQKLKKSKSFISQLFSGDKALNLKMIAQFQEIFNVKFIPSFKSYSEYTSSRKFGIGDYANYSDYELNNPAVFNLKEYQATQAA